MATKTLLAACAAVTLLAACAPTVFDPPAGGVTEAQFHRDNFECTMAAKNLVGDSFVMGPPLMIAAASIRHDEDIRAAHDECMLGKAYTVHRASR